MSIREAQVAFITGAGSGLGAAAARRLAQEGIRVALFSRTKDEIDEVARKIEAEGGEALPVCGDVAKSEDVFGAVRRVKDRWGRLDIAFANAGINGAWAPLEELTVAEWEETLSINLCGTFLTLKAALPLLKVRGGSVVITSSVNGTRMFSNSGATAYACSKAAQLAFAKMMALELARYRIRVNVICPGWIETQIQESTRQRHTDGLHPRVEFPDGVVPLTGNEPGRADQVARLVYFLASEQADHVTGTEVFIDGAQSLLQG